MDLTGGPDCFLPIYKLMTRPAKIALLSLSSFLVVSLLLVFWMKGQIQEAPETIVEPEIPLLEVPLPDPDDAVE